jgi:hypothetical protein
VTNRLNAFAEAMSKAPLTVCITGAAGQIGYALLPHICSGKTFGPDQPIKLHLLDLNIEGVQVALGGVKMELEDSTYPLLKGVVTTGEAKVRASRQAGCPLPPAFARHEGGVALRQARLQNRDEPDSDRGAWSGCLHRR